MSRILVDIGNSRLKYAHAGPALGDARSLDSGGPLAEALESAWGELMVPDALWIASVGSPSALEAVSAVAARLGWPEPRLAAVRREWQGFRAGYDDITGLGVDRWLAMVAARARCHEAFVVIDAGTAVTLDLVLADGTHQGGGIVPGLAGMRRALPGAIQHPNTDADRVPTFPATNTADGIAAGTLYGLADLINGLVARLTRSATERPRLFLTGGDAERLRPYLAGDPGLHPNLVLEGLAFVTDKDYS